MAEKVLKKTRIEVDESTLQRLNIYKAENKFKCHNETINELLNKVTKKK